MTTSHAADISSNGVAIADSSLNDTTFFRDNAFDDVFDFGASAWASSTGNDHNQVDSAYIGMDFRGTGQLWVVNTVGIQQHDSISGNRCFNIGIEVSSDDITWTVIRTFAPPDNNSMHHFATSETGGHAMWRLIQKVNISGGAGSVWQAQEVEFLGEAEGGGGGGVAVGNNRVAIINGLSL